MGNHFHRSVYDHVSLVGEGDIIPFLYECPRLRSVEISATEPRAMIRGRCGGGNRKEFEDEIDKFTLNKGYEYNEDCADDNTYAMFYFRLDLNKWIKYMKKNKDLVTETRHRHKCECVDSRYWNKKTVDEWLDYWKNNPNGNAENCDEGKK